MREGEERVDLDCAVCGFGVLPVPTGPRRYCPKHEAAMKRLYDLAEAKPVSKSPEPTWRAPAAVAQRRRAFYGYGYGEAP